MLPGRPDPQTSISSFATKKIILGLYEYSNELCARQKATDLCIMYRIGDSGVDIVICGLLQVL